MDTVVVENLVSGYGDVEVLHGVSLGVSEESVTCVIGPNGSGKSTLLKSLMGVVKPWSGRVLFNGEDITGLEPSLIIPKGIAVVPQGRRVFPYMTVDENLEMGGYSMRDGDRLRWRLEAMYELFPALRERSKQLSYTLSGGEQTQLCIARGLITEPSLLVLDEPSLGLSPKVVGQVFEIIKQVNEQGTTLLMVEQNVRKALSVADHVYILDLGQNRFDGTPEQLIRDPALVDVYLGRRRLGGS